MTNLPTTCNASQIQELYRRQAGTENVFDKLKNQWGFSGFAVKSRATTALAARMLLLVDYLSLMFESFLVPQKHTESSRGRRWFLRIAGRLAKPGSQHEMIVSLTGGYVDQ